jgi:hypothetical protein
MPKYGQTDVLWQNLLDKESRRLASLPVADLIDLATPPISLKNGVIRNEKITIEYCIWLETPDIRSQAVHSVILMAQRKLCVGLYRKYLAGFSVDTEGRAIPISEETLYSYD